jgi:RimJ/RimL family protein N-acetyltransferase
MRDPQIILRSVTDDDLPTLYEFQRDPVAAEMAGFPARDHDAFMQHKARILRDPNVRLYAVLSNAVLIGSVGGFEQGDVRQICYGIGREYWGSGYATAAVRAFLPIESQRPLHAYTAPHNIASQRVLLKCGFVQTGSERYEDNGVLVEDVAFRLD